MQTHTERDWASGSENWNEKSRKYERTDLNADDNGYRELRQCSIHTFAFAHFILCNNKINADIKNTLYSFRWMRDVSIYAISVHFHLISFLQICLQWCLLFHPFILALDERECVIFTILLYSFSSECELSLSCIAGYRKYAHLTWCTRDCAEHTKNLTICPSFVAIITTGKLGIAANTTNCHRYTTARYTPRHTLANTQICIVTVAMAVAVVVTAMGTMCDQSNLPLVPPTIFITFSVFSIHFASAAFSCNNTSHHFYSLIIETGADANNRFFSSPHVKSFYMHKFYKTKTVVGGW